MSRAAQVNRTVLGHKRRTAPDAGGELSAGKAEGKFGDIQVVQPQRFRRRADFCGQRKQDALDLVLFLRLQHPQLIVRLHHRHRLNENRRAGGGGVVNQSLDLILALHFDGNNIPPVPRGHKIILQGFGIRTADKVLERFLDAVVGIADFAAQIGKRGACFVGDHILRENRTRDALLQRPVAEKPTEHLIQRGCKGTVRFVVIGECAGGTQQARHLQQLARGEHCALFGTLARPRHVLHRAERRHSLGVGKPTGIGRPLQSARHLDRIVGWHQSAAKLLSALGCRAGGKQVADFVKFQRGQGLIGKTHDCFSLRMVW